MEKTKYPISKIRSGEVAVKLTSIEQYEKLDPSEKVSFFRKDKYYAFINGKLNDVHNWNITCDFSQIDWEEGKKETVEEAIKREYEARKFNSDFPFEPQSFKIGAKWQKEQLDKELSSLKAENERLKRENERLLKLNDELTNIMQKQILDNLKLNPSPTQELTLKQRMAWELYVAGFNHGIADKWTIAECYRSASIFINYKGGENEQ